VNAAGCQRDEMVGIAGGEIEIVQDHDHGRAARVVQIGQKIEHLDLVVDVEKSRRLVEQQDIRLLRQRHGDPDALALAARELIDRPFGKIEGLGGRKRVVDRLVVLQRPAGKQALMRMPPPADQIRDGDAFRSDRRLRQEA
jgi:hypothetical protein